MPPRNGNGVGMVLVIRQEMAVYVLGTKIKMQKDVEERMGMVVLEGRGS